MVYFAVITKVPDDCEGNYSCSEAYINPNAKKHVVGSNIVVSPPKFDEKLFGNAIMCKNNIIDLNKEQIVFCSTPVFRLGEILIMDSNDRTIPCGRKPSKWDVEHETFDTIEAAVFKSKEITK